LFVIGAVFYAASAIVWFRVISLEDLTTAYPVLIGVSFVAVSVGAVVFYEERVNLMKVAGMALILVGVALVGAAKA
jgi:multidrug transporter EmrE-like cation transporter